MLKRYIQENRKSIFITVVFTVALYAVMLLGNRISIDDKQPGRTVKCLVWD